MVVVVGRNCYQALRFAQFAFKKCLFGSFVDVAGMKKCCNWKMALEALGNLSPSSECLKSRDTCAFRLR